MDKLFILLFVFTFLSCSHEKTVNKPVANTSNLKMASGIVIADTIIYDVIIRNTNPDDSWAETCLKGLNRQGLIDSLFSMVYDKRLTAYDFDTHQPLKEKEIRQIETSKDFSRDKIGKIQFRERWLFNSGGIPLHKEIISIVPGYEVYTSTGELMGYKPVFVLDFN